MGRLRRPVLGSVVWHGPVDSFTETLLMSLYTSSCLRQKTYHALRDDKLSRDDFAVCRPSFPPGQDASELLSWKEPFELAGSLSGHGVSSHLGECFRWTIRFGQRRVGMFAPW